MKVVALVSGGKDSCYAMMKCIQYGHEIVALANLLPADDSVDELDSYMYQTVGHQIIVSYAECIGVPLFRKRIQGSTRHQNLSYRMTPDDEVEDMFILLREVKRQIPSVAAVSSGAIASDYQRLRVENICSRLGLLSLAFLWKQDQTWLLREMITNGIEAIMVKVAAIGLDPAKHLGKELSVLEPYLLKLKELYGINVCGEGGEYESLTLDCPLFSNARIVLDDFQVILHSPDSIAPVGVLHPLKFHLENKDDSKSSDPRQEKSCSVVEVLGDSPQRCEEIRRPVNQVNGLVETVNERLHISRTKKDDLFTIGCWLRDSCESTAGVQGDLTTVLREIELEFSKRGLGFQHVLYIHLYISDMNEFAVANETYVKFITHEKCPFGVPSRSTIELPLVQVGFGRAYVEVLVATDHTKRVLHVQSISCWAPSCIGPYSQATLHKGVLHMAGQLGLDPPTMSLCSGGVIAELEQALVNSEAIANTFKCSISFSAILFVVFCSKRITPAERLRLHEKLTSFLEQRRLPRSDYRTMSGVLDPLFLYVLVPDLPKRALVEIKPVLYVTEGDETENETEREQSCRIETSSWGFEPANWHDTCVQKCIIDGKICAIVLSISAEFATKICSEPRNSYQSCTDHMASPEYKQMNSVSRFCIHLLDKILVENWFSWEDTTNLRLYFPTSLGVSSEILSDIFTLAFDELAEADRSIISGDVPIFNLVPVLGTGKSASSTDNILTCELFAQRS